MAEREAALCSFSEYRLRLSGFERAEQREWERLRWQTWQLMAPHYKRGQMPRSAKAFCRFPWDKDITNDERLAQRALERSHITEDEITALNAHFDKLKQDGKIR